MKPTYNVLESNQYSSNEDSKDYVSREDLYTEIGYVFADLVNTRGGQYSNTCAARMSLALIKSGVEFKGRLPILAGPYKGKKIEPGANSLADELKRIWGKPKYWVDQTKAYTQIYGKKGVIYFHVIEGYGGGHIDLVAPGFLPPPATNVCHSDCHFAAKEIWLWELE